MTAPGDRLRVYNDVHDLLMGTELTDIVTYEVRGQRSEEGEEHNFGIEVLTRVEGQILEIRCKSSIQGGGGKYLVDAGAIFTLREAGEVADPLAREFAEKVGIMAIYPYLRANMSQLAAQLGVEKPLLPLLRAGEIQLSHEPGRE